MPIFGQEARPGDGTVESRNAYIATGRDGKPYVKNPEALWKEVSDLRDDSLHARKHHERLWALCWMFYKGDQWRKPSPTPEWNIIKVNVGKRPKITVNKILPMVQTRRAHVLKNRPTGIVMPASTDEEDRNSARVAQDILDYDREYLKNWELLDGKLSLCMFVTGNAFKKIYWDPTKGRKLERNRYKLDPVSGVPMMQEPQAPPVVLPSQSSVEPTPEQEFKEAETPEAPEVAPEPIIEGTYDEPEGDIVVEFVPPEEILPEPAATSLDECQRLLHRTLKTLKWVKDSFGEAAEAVESINIKTEKGKAIAQGAKLFGLTADEVANRVEVIEAWFRPSIEYPEGLHAVWADDKLMAGGPTPPAFEHIPFVHYQEIDTDEFWGMSSVSQVLDIQKALNLAVSRDEYMRQRLRPKLMAATDSGLDESQYSDDDAEIVYVHHPFYPKFTEPPSYERDTVATEFFKLAVDDIGGSSDIMRGQISGGDIRSGRMVNYLQEYAGTVLSGPARQIERGEEKTANIILRLRKHYTPEPRLYYIVGRNREVEVKSFLGSDIEGCGDYRVQTGSALPSSIAEKRDTVFTAVEKGILPPGDPRLVNLLGMPSDLDDIMDEKQLDRNNATEENHKFLSMTEEMVGEAYGILAEGLEQQTQGQASMMGLKPTPNDILDGMDLAPRDFEDHQTHLEKHNRERKSKGYKRLPKSVKALFDAHCDMHAFYLLPPPGPAPEANPGESGEESGGEEGPGNPQGNQERSEGAPPSRKAPMDNAHHTRGN